MFALYRLLLRPLTLGLMLLFVPAVAIALEMLSGEVAAPWRSLLHGDAAEPVRTALWFLAVTIPVVAGLIVAVARFIVLHTMTGWLLPDVRRRLLAGIGVTGVSVAALIAAPVVRAGDTDSAAALFSVSLFWFFAPAAVIDAGTKRGVRWSVSAAVLLAAAWPAHVKSLAEAQPAITCIVALALVALLAHGHVSRAVARRRIADLGQPWQMSRWLIRLLTPVRRPWRNSLATERVIPWLRAATHEHGRFPQPHLIQAAILTLAAHLTAMPALLLLLGGMGFASGGTHLGSPLLYPLSRRRRATIAWVGTVFDALLLCALAAALLPLVQWLPQPLAEESARSHSWPLSLGLLLALAPIPRWAIIAWGPPRHATGSLRNMLPLLPFAALALTALLVLGGARFTADPGTTALVVAALAVVVHGLHWLALHYFYRTRDLPTARD